MYTFFEHVELKSSIFSDCSGFSLKLADSTNCHGRSLDVSRRHRIPNIDDREPRVDVLHRGGAPDDLLPHLHSLRHHPDRGNEEAKADGNLWFPHPNRLCLRTSWSLSRGEEA